MASYITPGTPNLADYTTFLQLAGFVAVVLNPASPYIQWTLGWATPYVGVELFCADANQSTQAVYNLATSMLLQICPDEPGQTAFADLRSLYGINGKGYGLITSAGDQGTSAGYMVPASLDRLTLGDLQNLKNPWGAAYLAYVQNYGSNLWGLS